MNRGRFQAQGPGVEKSLAWATDDTIYKHIGINHIDDLQGRLTPAEFRDREIAIQKARNYVNNAPADGVFSFVRKTFNNTPQNRKVRFDVDIFEGAAFVTQPAE